MITSFKKQLQRTACSVCALAVLLASIFPLPALAAGGASVDGTVTSADARDMSRADAAVEELVASEQYDAMTEADRTQAAVEQLEQLAEQGLVRKSSIYIDEENDMVTFSYRCGALGGIMLTEPDDSNLSSYAVLPDENGVLELSGSRYEFLGSAVIYYAFDDLVNSSRYPYYAYMQAFWTTMGLTTTLNTSVTVADLRGMDKYDLCVLSTHGSYFTYQSSYFSGKMRTDPVILLLEDVSVAKDMLYGFDLLAHRVIKVNGKYCVTPAFFRSAYRGGQLDGTLIVSETCEFLGVSGSENGAMAEALLAGGAETVLGYVNNVYTVYSRSMTWDIVNRLIMGQNIGQALDHAKNTYGTDDLIWYHSKGGKRPHAVAAYAEIYGSTTAALRSAAEVLAAA